jgi:hypothetical protein
VKFILKARAFLLELFNHGLHQCLGHEAILIIADFLTIAVRCRMAKRTGMSDSSLWIIAIALLALAAWTYFK